MPAVIPDSTCLKLCGHLGPDMSSCEPMALVVGVAEAEKQSSGTDPQAKELSGNADSNETRYSMFKIFIIIFGPNCF